MTRQAKAHFHPPSRRTRFLLSVFLLWGAIVIAKLAQLMLIDRDQYLAEMTRRSVFVGQVPSRRGRLLDREGRILAWSARHFRLRWDVPQDTAAALQDWARLKTTCKGLPAWSESDIFRRVGTSLCVLENLAVETVTSPQRLMAIRGVRLESFFVRHYCSDPAVAQLLGRVEVVDGVEIGVSGAEKTHDALLRGRLASYRVMVDKHGKWIPETWQKTGELRPGFDVHLPISHPAADRPPTWSQKPPAKTTTAGGQRCTSI